MHVLSLVPLLLVTQLQPGVEAPAAPAEVCIACQADVVQLRSGYAPDAWEKMASGKVITSTAESKDADGNPKSRVEAAAIMGFSPTQVWTVLADFEARPKFISAAKEIRILKTEGNRIWIAEHLKVLLFNIRFQAVNTLDAERGILSWALDKSAPHDIADTTGAWEVGALAARQTLVKYGASVDTGRPVPGFVENFLTERSLPGVLSGLRDELQRRFP